MDDGPSVIGIAAVFILFLAGLRAFFLWITGRATLPSYVHICAFIGLVVGILIAIGDPGDVGFERIWWIIPGMPGLVYVSYFFFLHGQVKEKTKDDLPHPDWEGDDQQNDEP